MFPSATVRASMACARVNDPISINVFTDASGNDPACPCAGLAAVEWEEDVVVVAVAADDPGLVMLVAASSSIGSEVMLQKRIRISV